MGRTIALLTDFGLRDGYVAAMKGVIYSIDSEIQIIDITHEIEPQNINAAAFVLWNVYPYFPKKTVFVSVVDPGVGSSRDIICVKTKNHTFLAPDNGLLKFILGNEKIKRIRTVENKKYFLPYLSNTFHGRDIFAPAAVQIVNGKNISCFGKKIVPTTMPEKFLSITKKLKKSFEGKIVHIDRFGNIITNILFEDCGRFKGLEKVIVGKTQVQDFKDNYTQQQTKSPFCIIGSRNLLEISIRNGDAAKKLKVKAGSPVKLVSYKNE